MPRRKGGGAVPSDRVQAAAYVADMARGLAAIARQHGLETLGYILEMAREEAERNAAPGNGASRS